MHAIKSSFSEFASCISENKQTNKKKTPREARNSEAEKAVCQRFGAFLCVEVCLCVGVCLFV